MVAIAFDLAVAERFVDRAVRIEHAHATGVAMPEVFSRRTQHGGLVIGELLYAAGVGLVLAGVLTFVGARSRSPRRLWLLAVGACAFGVAVLPALVYPPLPPGVATSLPIGERQLLYVATVAIGIAALLAAVAVWRLTRRRRAPLRAIAAALAVLVPAALAVALLPDSGAAHSLPSSVLLDFRIVAVANQLLFWLALGLAGAWLLRRMGRDAA
jgi:predicted cobalt transporter CbtA